MDEIKEAKDAVELEDGCFTHKLKKPVEYNGTKVEELSFDFESLTGQDAIDIENELTRQGIPAVVPVLSGEYLIRMCAKACCSDIGSDIFLYMGMYDHNKIKAAARSFLLKSE